jgi:uncharacterized membrane protein YjjP (DUF1212 family)
MESLTPTPGERRPKEPTADLLEFLFRLGQGYLASGEQTAKVEVMLREVAEAYGMGHARVVALPTALFISVHDGESEKVTLAQCEPQTSRLDQIAEIYQLGREAREARLSPAEGLARLSAIRGHKPRFGMPGIVVGHAILTVGLAMVLMPTSVNLCAAAVVGFLVGLIKLCNRGRAVFSIPLPVIAAAIVSAVVFLAVRRGIPIDPLHALVPPLVTFLPGAILTLGMVELAYGDMVSGASRLMAGFVQLVLLAFGLGIGAALVGYLPEDLVSSTSAHVDLPWAAWAGVVVFGLGVYLHFSAPPHSLHWMLLVLLLAFGAQRLAVTIFSSEISGFFGTLVATPVAYLIEQRFRGPPAAVTFLPSFWMLVPGALGLLSVTRMLSDRPGGVDGLITVLFVIASIALGTLVGASLHRAASEGIAAGREKLDRASSALRMRNRDMP